MGWLFDNFQILLVLGIAFAAWLKNRGEAKEEEESERQAREEMIRHLQEVEERQVQRTPPVPQRQAPPASQRSGPPPVPQKWSTAPQGPPPTPRQTPPKLKDIFQELADTIENKLDPQPEQGAYASEDTPWDFEHVDASHSEITEAADPNEPVLDRQRKMQERIAELRRQAEEAKGQVGGARETQRRASGQSRASIQDMPPIAEVLKDRSQTRRAIILNEILDKPLGLRGAS